LGASKVKVLKSLEESVPAAFVRFYSSSLFDRLLQGLVLYFCALFQQELLKQWCVSDKSRKANTGGYWVRRRYGQAKEGLVLCFCVTAYTHFSKSCSSSGPRVTTAEQPHRWV
jgi:hypothetical protein